LPEPESLQRCIAGGVAANANETPIQSTSWRAEQAGRKAEAILDLRKSADLQDRLGLGCNTIKPMREMLADLLPMNGDLVQAFVEYQSGACAQNESL